MMLRSASLLGATARRRTATILAIASLSIGCASGKNERAERTDDVRAEGDAAAGESPLSDAAQRPPTQAPTDASPRAGGDDPSVRGAGGCAPMRIAAGGAVEGTPADTFFWSDATCQPRSAALLRNDRRDAFGQHGGYLRTYGYVADGKPRTLTGSESRADTWNGFGYLVNHYADAYADNRQVAGSHRTVLAGPHHAIHEFKVRVQPGGPVDVTVHWLFATGRAHPLYAITFDATASGPDALRADTRAPYGDLAWDGARNGRVDGLGWGDARRLTLTSALSAGASWDYTGANVVPHAYEWSSASDAEMGLVATQSFATRPQGGDYGMGALSQVWNRRGDRLLTDIPDWQWPFQLNQYELPGIDWSHRLAWGASYGAVGQRAYSAFGKTLSGYPYQSYTVAMVLGTHAASAVAAQLADVEAALATTLTATRGTVAVRAAAGVARSDEAPLSPPGWDATYAAWTIDAEDDGATLRLDTSGAALVNPVLVLRGYRATTPPRRVTLGGEALTPDADYFATVDAAGARLWVTLQRTLRGRATITIE